MSVALAALSTASTQPGLAKVHRSSNVRWMQPLQMVA